MGWFWAALAGAVFGRRSAPHGAGSVEDEDIAIARRLVTRDAEAFALLYDRHARALFSLALRMLGDQHEAEDVVQDVFTQAWRQADRYDPGRGRPIAWLLNMARSRAIDRLRRRRQAPLEDHKVPDLPEPAPGADAFAVADEARAIRRALQDLPHLQRTAIELAYFEGCSQSEIAARLEQPLGTVKTRVRLGLLRLREAMAGSRS